MGPIIAVFNTRIAMPFRYGKTGKQDGQSH